MTDNTDNTNNSNNNNNNNNNSTNNDNNSVPEQSSDPLVDDPEALAVIVHIAALLTTFIGPLILLLVSDDEFVQRNVRNALNWEIMVLIYSFIGALLLVVAVGFLVLAAVAVLNTVFCIVAAYKASQGEAWVYPLTYEFL